MTPNTNHDLSLLRWLFTSLQEMAGALGLDKDARRWRRVFKRLDDFAVEPPNDQPAADADWLPIAGGLMLSPDESLKQSHRHFAHLMPIYPLGLLHIEGDQHERQIISQSIDTLDLLGSGQWVCFSYVWMACLAARADMPQRAVHNLRCFIKGITSRNGFNVNGDIHNMGLCAFKGAVVTLETNFGAVQAVHEMLLQSWGGKVRIFPAVPDTWSQASFDDLRAEGGFKVSAKRKGGRTTRIRIKATVAGELVLSDPFAGAKVTWRSKRMRQRGGTYHCKMKKGDVVEATI
jgi:alpha-L-fucosidase 2